MDKSDTSTYWKKIWTTLTGQSKLTTEDDVNNVLKVVKKDLSTGICIFKGFTPESFEEWRKTRLTVNPPFQQFVKRLSTMLNLETTQAWKVFCNFLMYEYYGSIADIERTADIEIYNEGLFEQVWLFYSAERMYLLKSLKHIMKYCLKEDYKFYHVYMNFITNINHIQIRNSLFKQFKNLLVEITLESSSNCHEFKDWVSRNQQEQFEVINCIIKSEEFLPLSMAEFKELFLIFKMHDFTQEPAYYKVLDVIDSEELRRLRRLEVMALLIGLNSCWQTSNTWDTHKEEIEDLINSTVCEGYISILLLAWATLQMTLPRRAADEIFDAHYNKFTKAALKQRVFIMMYEIVCDPIIQKTCFFNVIQKALYNLLDFVCEKFDDDGTIIEHEGIVQLAAELIKNPELAEKFIEEGKNKANVVYKILQAIFPCSFESYSEIIVQLLKHDALLVKVIDILGDIQHFTEEYQFKTRDCVVTVQEAYKPYECVSIKAGSQAVIFGKFGKHFMRYDTTRYTYFTLGREKINRAIFNQNNPQCHLKTVELYYEVLSVILEKSALDKGFMKDSLEATANILIHLSKSPPINYRLMKLCLDIFASQMKNYSEEILDALSKNNYLPYVTGNVKDLSSYFKKNFLKPNIILLSIQDQISQGEYGILYSYINIIKAAPKTRENRIKIHIPGTVLLLMNFFPTHLDLFYKRINEKYELMQICLEYFFDTLTTMHNKTDEYDKIMYDLCYELLSNYEPTVSALIRIFRISNVYLHTRMLKEPDWENGITYTIIKCLKICLNIITRLFTLHNIEERSLQGKTFLKRFLDKSFTPSCLRILLGYLNHAFDTAIPKMSIQLLKKIAANDCIHILALIEMDQFQVQNIILDKLRDPLEEETVKIAVLELITLSIKKQNGLTAAFFDLRQYSSKKPSAIVDTSDSILSFMEEYLDNIKKSSTYLNSPVQSAVLDLFHTLWMYRKDILVEQLKQGESFWSTLVDPLFRDLKLPNRTYSQLYNIVTYELFKSKGKNGKINEIVEKLFDKNMHYAKIWCKHILTSLDEDDVVMNSQSLLRSWKDFVMSVMLLHPKYVKEITLQRLLTETCLSGLVQHFQKPEDIRILTSWAEMYLLLIKQFPEVYKDPEETFITLTKAFKYLGEYYDHVSSNFKEIMLTIAIKTIQDLSEFMTTHPILTEGYIFSIGETLEKEFMKITSNDVQPTDEQAYNEWLLLLIFANNLITMNFAEMHPSWFSLTQFVNKVVMSVGLFTSNPIYFSIAKVAVSCLMNFAKTKLYTEFISIDFEAFFDSTKPPRRFMCADMTSFQNPLPWYFGEWWLIYMGIIKLMTTLFNKLGALELKVFLAFTSIHYEVIRNVLRLPKVTVDMIALQLTAACFHLLYKLLVWRQEWKVTQPNIYSNLIATIYETMNGVTCIFLRPKILTFYTIETDGSLRHVENVPIELFVNIMDELMKITGLCCMCLLRVSPKLLSLLALPDKGTFINDVRIEYDFHVPRMHEEHSRRITYATILCLMNFLCKAVTYARSQKHTPQKDATPDEFTTSNLLAFVWPDGTGGYKLSEHSSSTSTEISNLSTPWLMKLNLSYVQSALEVLTSVVAIQTYIDFNILKMKPDVRLQIKKELCSELMYFYEFVRKRYIDPSRHRTVDNMVYRRHLSWTLPYPTNINEAEVEMVFVKKTLTANDDESNSDEIESFSDLDSRWFFTKYDFANIDEPSGSGDAARAPSRIVRGLGRKPHYGEKLANSRIYRIPLDKILLKYPKLPEIRDTDYLLCLIHWLIFFCDLSQY